MLKPSINIILILVIFIDFSTSQENKRHYSAKTMDRVKKLLTNHPVVDTHNDYPVLIRWEHENNLYQEEFDTDLLKKLPHYWSNHCDLPRMRKGHVGGQFWSAWMDCNSSSSDAVQLFLEQVDIIKQWVDKYPDDLMWADSAKDVEEALETGKIASLIGVEGGQAIGSSLSVLRILYTAGVRYMTLTHSCNTPWADAAETEFPEGHEKKLEPRSNGLSSFGKKVIINLVSRTAVISPVFVGRV